MTTDWRELATRFPDHTLLRDPAAYADVFAAIDEALARAAGVEPSPNEYDVLTTVKDRDEDGEEVDVPLLVWRVPVVPVRVPNTVRLCLGIMQYYHWPVERPEVNASLPYVDVLLKRKLRPTLDEAVDLAAFLTVRSNDVARENYVEPSAAILKLIEANCAPPVPEPLAAVLRESKRRVGVTRDNYVAMVNSYHGRPQVKRFAKWIERLDRLLGTEF
jgi:hypothetical protein